MITLKPRTVFPKIQITPKVSKPRIAPMPPVRNIKQNPILTMTRHFNIKPKYPKPIQVGYRLPQKLVVPKPPNIANKLLDLKKRKSPLLSKARSVVSNASKIKGIGKDRILVMIAAGPSVLEVDFKPLLNIPTIDIMCINKPVSSVWPSRFWAFCDHTQYIRNQEAWGSYTGTIINSPNVSVRRPNQILVPSMPGKGFSFDLTKGYHIGRSSTYANMQTAVYMDYKKIFIFGLDMGEVNGKLWHYGVNPDVNSNNRVGRFAEEAKSYQWAADNLPTEIKNKFVICSEYNKWEFTKKFEKISHKEAINRIVEYVKT